jgi:hypothetical protein
MERMHMLSFRRKLLCWLLIHTLSFLVVLPKGLAQNSTARAPDPLEILKTRITHGLGDSPMKTALRGPLLQDGTNAALLVTAADGITISNLLATLPASQRDEQRIATLVKVGLLTRDGDRVRTAFPILFGERREKYRRLISRTASRVYPDLLHSLQPLFEELKKRRWGKWSYHFVMAQVFDSQFTWSRMIEQKIVPPLTPPVAWAVYPPHPFKTGTNYYYDAEHLGEYVLPANWAPVGAPVPELIGGHWRLIEEAALRGAPPNTAGAKQLRELGLLGGDGQVLVPVIGSSDPVYGLLQKLGNSYVALLLSRMPLKELAQICGVEPGLAWIIAFHELNWELLNRLVGAGVLERPSALGSHWRRSRPSMVGVCSVVATYEPFFKLPN